MAQPFQDDTILARWLSNALSPEEASALRERDDFAAYERIARAAEGLRPPPYDAQAELARLRATRLAPQSPSQHLRSGAQEEKAVAPTRLRRLRPWYAVAAALALLLTAWLFWPDGAVRYRAGAGETELAALPDGSTVRINAGSTLAFDATAESRAAELAGEAFFEVEKATVPFVVTTAQGEVTVLGTSFNVYSRDGEMRVSCATGRVRVSFAGNSEDFLLTPGNSVALAADGTVATTATDAAEALDWLDGQSAFKNRPLAEVLRELERQFALKIDLPPGLDDQQLLSTSFPNDDADRALEIALSPLSGVTYTRSGQRVVLRLNE
ncbi:FecR domain-containing protein [Neolewinella lacunae]|uniref:FecR domain-containing protein n=1 Tax=Neolewinella lacunae TaxID=1517758 RepID=A0A923TAD5_9BACT|nr:FecR domain-containing protein [Neolewinella lacunae]MBC6996416.1 FecR domain-containing protein [Neolewinella lacunae]MDN3633641.1 FecR domain-containing protein [Neolewinella lacunae]